MPIMVPIAHITADSAGSSTVAAHSTSSSARDGAPRITERVDDGLRHPTAVDDAASALRPVERREGVVGEPNLLDAGVDMPLAEQLDHGVEMAAPHDMFLRAGAQLVRSEHPNGL